MSQLSSLCTRLNVRVTVTYGTTKPVPEDFANANPWTVTLFYESRRMTVPFFTGSALTSEPTAADVLHCLLSDSTSVDNARDFQDWASDFGYDVDSRKAHSTYKACQSISKRLHKFLGDDFEMFATAEH